MPNWCENSVIIYGNPDQLDEFAMKVRESLADTDGKNGVMGCYLPIPTDLSNNPSPIGDDEIESSNLEKYGARDWYDWAVKNWGSKWGDCHTTIDEVDENSMCVEINYDSAWGPCTAGFVAISEKFPDFVFMEFYRESGMGFAGYTVIIAGEIIQEHSADIIPDAGDSEFILYGLDEQILPAALR